jgi:putative membrane protein
MTLTITLDQFFLYLRYMGVGILMMSAFIIVYLYITPAKEIRLIKEGCTAAALSFGGAVLGFCLTLSSSATNSNNIATFIVWGLCSAIVQLLVYFAVVRLIPNANMEIEDNNVAVGVLFCVLSLAIGVLNSACLS